MTILHKILIGLSFPAVAFVLAGAVGPHAERSPDQTLRDLKVYSEALQLVSRHYVEAVDFRQLARGTYQGLAESLDPWSSYYDPERMKPLLARDHSADV